MGERPRRRARLTASAVLGMVVALGGCDAGRDGGLRPLPGQASATSVFVPGTVGAADLPYVEALASNFVDGGRLVARLDAEPARCVADRWIAILNPTALAAAGIESTAMGSITLDRLRAAVSIDATRAVALTASYDACGADHTAAFLDSLLLTSQITPTQRVCLGEEIPAGLVGEITVSVLTEVDVDADLTARYQQALDRCPP
ncbi:MAG: hypothetical protein ACK5OX_12605 [Desertimonas sp.]